MTEPYHGGIELRTLGDRQSAGVDIRAHHGLVHLTISVSSERGATTTTVDFVGEDDLNDLILALREARDRAKSNLSDTGAAA